MAEVKGKIRPRCYDREPAPKIRIRYGVDQTTGEIVRFEVDDGWSSPGCKTWDGVGIGRPTEEYPSGTPYPIAHGWDCTGCRWLPEKANQPRRRNG